MHAIILTRVGLCVQAILLASGIAEQGGPLDPREHQRRAQGLAQVAPLSAFEAGGVGADNLSVVSHLPRTDC